MSKKILTVKEWAQKYLEWYNSLGGDDGADITETDIVNGYKESIGCNEDNSENRLPTIKGLNNTIVEVIDINESGQVYKYRGEIFEIKNYESDNILPNEDFISDIDEEKPFKTPSLFECIEECIEDVCEIEECMEECVSE